MVFGYGNSHQFDRMHDVRELQNLRRKIAVATGWPKDKTRPGTAIHLNKNGPSSSTFTNLRRKIPFQRRCFLHYGFQPDPLGESVGPNEQQGLSPFWPSFYLDHPQHAHPWYFARLAVRLFPFSGPLAEYTSRTRTWNRLPPVKQEWKSEAQQSPSQTLGGTTFSLLPTSTFPM